jgi:hypothetical protein
MPTTTALQARVPIFQPTDRPSMRGVDDNWIETTWGRCRVAGRLGQRHADALQAILHTAIDSRGTADGSLELLVDPAAVRRAMSDAGYSDQQLKKLLFELRTCAVEIQAPSIAGVPWIIGGLLDHVEPSTKTVRNPLGGERHLLRVRLGKPLVVLLEHDLVLKYDPTPIARLKYGISKAIVRHVKTHRDAPRGGWKTDRLIAAVGGPTAGNGLRNRRREIAIDARALESCGLVLMEGGARACPLPACSSRPAVCNTGPAVCSSSPARVALARR